MNLYSFTNDVLVLYIDKIILYHSHGNLDTTGLLVNIDYYYVCIVLYALYADTVRYVLYIDNKVLLLFILVFIFAQNKWKHNNNVDISIRNIYPLLK